MPASFHPARICSSIKLMMSRSVTALVGTTRSAPLLGALAAGAASAACVLTPAALPGQTAGVAGYSKTIVATGCSASTFTITSGSLPTGMSLNASTGVLSGTPATAGTVNFTVSYNGTAQPYTFYVWSSSITCSPVTLAATIHQGTQLYPPTLNGIEGQTTAGGAVPNYSGARLLWTSSALSNAQRILFSTAASWVVVLVVVVAVNDKNIDAIRHSANAILRLRHGERLRNFAEHYEVDVGMSTAGLVESALPCG